MSKISLAPNASGTGTLTIAAPNTNTDRTLTLPDESGTVLTSASPVIAQAGVPAFSAYQSGSTNSLANATYTKISFQAEEYDTTGAYDTATSRFTPNVAGYYFVCGSVSASVSGGAYNSSLIYKNGSILISGFSSAAVGVYGAVPVSGIVYLNGSTDYIELYFVQNTGGTQNTYATSTSTRFQAVLVRAA